eukprot:jgi/Psemu1/56587/gm1.56587_g
MVKVIGLVLMVVSNLASWHAVTKAIAVQSERSPQQALRSAVWKIALFYTLWALYNKYLGGRPQELGHISLGLLTASCLATSHFQLTTATKIPVVASCGLVVLNFAVVIPLMISAGGPVGMARKVWKGDTSALAVVWGYTFTAYILSNVVLWSWVLYQFVVAPDDAAGAGEDSRDL